MLLIIPTIIIITYILVQFIRNKIYQPKYEGDVQRPGTLERFITKFMVFLTVFAVFFTFLGIFTKESEMTIVFSCIAIFFFLITILLRYGQDMSYVETEHYFIIRVRKKEYKVYYHHIIDWAPAYNEIAVFDETKANEDYIKVNIKMFKPEILLRKIADMAMDGKFNHLDSANSVDQAREIERLNYLIVNNYGYLVEDYIATIKKD